MLNLTDKKEKKTFKDIAPKRKVMQI